MLKFVVLLSFVACALGAGILEGILPQLGGRIIDGFPTTVDSVPYIVSLQRNNRHFCGGSILNNRAVLTAANCLQGVSASSLKVRAGSTYSNSGGINVQVASFKIHEGYNASTMVNDIAVVRLSSPLTYGAKIRNIDLASSLPNAGASLVLTGWGTNSSGGVVPNRLQRVNAIFFSQLVCASAIYDYSNQLDTGIFCAAASEGDACQGDSGSPLAYNGSLLGVASWGPDCDNSKYPGFYASVPNYRPWIIHNFF